jgi:hypothetical protein
VFLFSYISTHGYGCQQEGHSGMNGMKKEAAGYAKLFVKDLFGILLYMSIVKHSKRLLFSLSELFFSKFSKYVSLN